MCRSALILCAVLALAGCTVGPDYRRPPQRVDGAFATTQPSTQPTTQMSDTTTQPSSQSSTQPGEINQATTDLSSWWTGLHDPILDHLVRKAQAANLDLKLAQSRIKEARARRALAGAEGMPTANLDGSFSHNQFSRNAAPFNAFDVPGFPWNYNLYQAGFDAAWEIDVFGGARRTKEAADAELGAAQESGRDVMISIVAEVARNYTELRGVQRQAAIARENLSIQRQTLELTNNLMQKGVRDRLDVARSESQVDQTRALLPSYEILENQAINRLAVLTREPAAELEKLLTAEGAMGVPAAAEAVSIGVPADLLRRRPDIRMAERRVAAACARVGAATADLYPKFSIVGNFAMQSASVSDLFAWPSRAYSVGPTVTWPIFDAGRIRSNIKIRDTQLDQALIIYESTVEQALEETRDALTSFQKEQERSLALSEAVRADTESVDLAQKQYKNGIADFLVVLDSQRQLLISRDALARSQTRSTTSLISLYKALGGGWDAPLDSMPAPANASGSTTAPADSSAVATSQPQDKSQR